MAKPFKKKAMGSEPPHKQLQLKFPKNAITLPVLDEEGEVDEDACAEILPSEDEMKALVQEHKEEVQRAKARPIVNKSLAERAKELATAIYQLASDLEQDPLDLVDSIQIQSESDEEVRSVSKESTSPSRTPIVRSNANAFMGYSTSCLSPTQCDPLGNNTQQ